MKAKKFLDKGVAEYEAMKTNYEEQMSIVDSFIESINKLVRAHDETNIDHMKDVGLDFWMQIYLMRRDISIMKIHRDITLLKYKRMCIKDGEDKRDVKDKIELVGLMYFSEIDGWESMMFSIGNLHTTLRGEIKMLTGDKRSAEYVGV